MGSFRLGKPSMGKADVSTGPKLHMGKLPNCLFGVHINEPTGNVMALHDAYRGKEFQPNDAGLDGYPYRAEVAYNPSVGGSEGYQFLVKTYYAEDAEHGGDAENVNGTEVLDGEPTPIPKIYLNKLCRWDFGDVRFQLKGVTGTTAYTYKLIEKVDGVSALFLFKMNENPDTARTVCCYWGKQTATDESSDAAAEAIITGATLQMPLDEIAVADTNVTPWDSGFENNITGWSSINNTLFSRSNSQAYSGSYSFKVKRNDMTGLGGVAYTVGTLQVGKIYRLAGKYKMVNGASNATVKLTSNATAAYLNGTTFTDLVLTNQTEWTSFSLDIIASQLTDGNINAVFLGYSLADTTVELYVDDLTLTLLGTSGVTAVDYSGNGNHGTATGTTIVASPYPNKNARRTDSYANNGIEINKALDTLGITDEFTICGKFRFADADLPENTNTWFIQFMTASPYATHLNVINGFGGHGLACNSNFSEPVTGTKLTVTDTNWKDIVIRYDGANLQLKINDDFDTKAVTGNLPAFDNIRIGFNQLTVSNRAVEYCGYFVTNTYLSDEQLAKLKLSTGNYPDQRLIEGSVVVRKWASTTLPTVASVSSMQTRKSYGKQELYPALDNLNFTLDQANKKASVEFYLENTQRESPNATVLYSGQPNYWAKAVYATGNLDLTATQDGDRLKVDVTYGAGGYGSVSLTKTINQDWSNRDFAVYEIECFNSGNVIALQYRKSESEIAYYYINDNFVGKKLIVVPLKTLDQDIISSVASIRIGPSAAQTTSSFTFYIRRVVIDDGVWAKVEIGVPDQLQQQGTLASNAFDLDKIRTYLWNGATWGDGAKWDSVNWVWYSGTSVFLNGTSFRTVYGETYDHDSKKCATLFIKGKRGETKGKKSTSMATQTITYSKAKTKYRIGFAIKMPPADLNASATTGIGQCKLKLEVYYQ